MLQDVLASFAKKLIINMNIKELQNETIHQLSNIFLQNKGDHQVTFEVEELESFKRIVEAPVVEAVENDAVDTEMDVSEDEEMEVNVATEIEETRIVTRLSMPRMAAPQALAQAR